MLSGPRWLFDTFSIFTGVSVQVNSGDSLRWLFSVSVGLVVPSCFRAPPALIRLGGRRIRIPRFLPAGSPTVLGLLLGLSLPRAERSSSPARERLWPWVASATCVAPPLPLVDELQAEATCLKSSQWPRCSSSGLALLAWSHGSHAHPLSPRDRLQGFAFPSC